jgi:hypothetical protein
MREKIDNLINSHIRKHVDNIDVDPQKYEDLNHSNNYDELLDYFKFNN